MSPSQNRSRPPAIASPSSGDMASPWSSLPMDLLQLVGWRVLAGDLLDYVRFRAVCTHWRSSTTCPLGRGIVDPRFHPRRWMMLPQGHHCIHPADGKKRFFNLFTGAFARVRHPLLTGFHRVLDSVDGLLLVQPSGDDAMVRLLHPFTGDAAEFPPLMPVLKSHWNRSRYRWVELKFVTSLRVGADGAATVMIVNQHIPLVFYATTKDPQWSVSAWSLAPHSMPISFQGKLYILEPLVTYYSRQSILRLDPPNYDPDTMISSLMPPKLIATCPTDITSCLMAECDSEILVVGRDDAFLPSSKMLVYRLADLTMGKAVPIKSIGGNTLFLDIQMSTAIVGVHIHVVKSMTSSPRVMPTIPSDTIIRHRYDYPLEYRGGYPRQYDLRTGTFSKIMGRCVNHDQLAAAASCNCSLIYHIYQSCHCTGRMLDWLSI